MEEEEFALFKSNSKLNKKDLCVSFFSLNGQCLFTFCVLIVSQW